MKTAFIALTLLSLGQAAKAESTINVQKNGENRSYFAEQDITFPTGERSRSPISESNSPQAQAIQKSVDDLCASILAKCADENPSDQCTVASTDGRLNFEKGTGTIYCSVENRH